jgi:hypothetical protein
MGKDGFRHQRLHELGLADKWTLGRGRAVLRRRHVGKADQPAVDEIQLLRRLQWHDATCNTTHNTGADRAGR